jgi:hypothetical protein
MIQIRQAIAEVNALLLQESMDLRLGAINVHIQELRNETRQPNSSGADRSFSRTGWWADASAFIVTEPESVCSHTTDA